MLIKIILNENNSPKIIKTKFLVSFISSFRLFLNKFEFNSILDSKNNIMT
jgi:hypothetical protein